MLHTIENDYLRVSVDDHGAELCSIFDKVHNREVIWQADPAYWKRHAPVLFPNVGRHFEDHYPYDFELKIKHVLEKNQVSVCWEVISLNDETMYFTIGGHPAFNVPAGGIGSQEQYHLTFDGRDSLSYLLIDMSSGTAVADKAYTLELENGSCLIDAHMFDKDALIFDDQIEKAGIAFPDGTPYLELSCHGFPSFGIWSVPGSPFVCLEPWMGRCDDFGFKGELPEKKYINTLNKDEIFTASYEIKIY